MGVRVGLLIPLMQDDGGCRLKALLDGNLIAKGFPHRVKQKVVDLSTVPQRQRGQFFRQGKDDLEIGDTGMCFELAALLARRAS